jgi:hypothetical protein
VYQQQQQEQQEQQQDAENPFLDPPFSRIKRKKRRMGPGGDIIASGKNQHNTHGTGSNLNTVEDSM